MNPAQIKKLQNKVAKKVNADIEKQEKEEKEKLIKNLIEIRNTIVSIQKKLSNRGACLCIWNDKVYTNKNNRAIILKRFCPKTVLDDSSFEVVKSENGKVYYMMNEINYKEEKEIMEWMSNHYANLKMSLYNCNSTDPHTKVQSAYLIGSIVTEFTEKFPTKNIFDLKNYISVMDQLLSNNF